MPLTQQVILAAIFVFFALLPLVLLYGWIVTKGWEQTPPIITSVHLDDNVDHTEDLPKAA